VLHAFKKKSKRGIKTPQSDIDLIWQRLKTAEADHASRTKREPRK
jgi:phage-related protein